MKIRGGSAGNHCKVLSLDLYLDFIKFTVEKAIYIPKLF